MEKERKYLGMDNETLQQFEYSRLMIGTWLKEGAKIWNFSYSNPVPTKVKLNGRFVDTKELSDYAIIAKRNGRYADALGAYLNTMSACVDSTGKIPIEYARGLFKVFVCINAFWFAYQIASTVYADIQQSTNVDPQEEANFQSYFYLLMELSKAVIDRNDFSQVKPFCANYSGNAHYTLQASEQEIKAEFKGIRDSVRTIYGM